MAAQKIILAAQKQPIFRFIRICEAGNADRGALILAGVNYFRCPHY
jgi:hypothetical protein